MKTWIICEGGLGNQLNYWYLGHILTDKNSKKSVILAVNPNDKYRQIDIENLMKLCSHNIKIKRSKFTHDLKKFIEFIEFRTKAPVKNILPLFGFIRQEKFSKDDWPKILIARKRNSILTGHFDVLNKKKDFNDDAIGEIRKFLESEIKLKFLNNLSKYQVCHIRRGDYLENQDTLGVLDLQYYMENIDPELFTIVTSEDDLGNSEKSKFPPKTLFLTAKDISTWETLKLMSCSTRLIMANSSLSIWGSLLQKQNSVRIAPYPWYKRRELFSEITYLDIHTLKQSYFV